MDRNRSAPQRGVVKVQSWPPPDEPINWAALIEAGILGGTGAMLLVKAWQGVLVFYLHPRYAPLVVACGIALLLAAPPRLRRTFGRAEPLRGRGAGYLLVALPLLLGTLVPARPLGAAALTEGPAPLTAAGGSAAALGDDTRAWNLYQWATALSTGKGGTQGGPADVVGFVYHNPARPLDGFYAVRYVIVHCAADSRAVGLPVVWSGGAALPADGWVRVRGVLGTATIEGKPVPAILAGTVDPVPQPINPYLYR